MFLVVNKAPANIVDPETGSTAVFPETGTYFLYFKQDERISYVSSISLPAKSEIVPIPQEFVEGLEETTANASEALEMATGAQSTADAAQSAASNTKPIVIEAEANASNGTVNLTADGISKMNTLDSRYENGNPCPAYLHYAVNGENVYMALIFSQLRNYYFRNDYTVSIYVVPDTENGWKLISEPKT